MATSNFTYNSGNPLASTATTKPTVTKPTSQQAIAALAANIKSTNATATAAENKFVTSANATPGITPEQKPLTVVSTNRNTLPTAPPMQGYEWKWLSLPGSSGTGQWKQYPIVGYVPPTDGTSTTAVPGSTGLAIGSTRTLARDTFANTFALIFGAKEASQSYVGKLYDLVSGFYKTGSTMDDSINLAIRQAKEENAIPEFTKRFAGIFALDEQFKAGKAIAVPTIAEFFAAEAKMGDVLTNAGLGDLATQEFLGGVIGKGKSVLEVGNLISNTFSTIDNAPDALKKTLAIYFPGVDRASIAKALLTGAEGAAELDKKIKGISVLSAAGSQGLTTDLATASDIAAQGYNYQEALTGFSKVNDLQRADELARLTGDRFTQNQAIQATFGKSVEQKQRLEKIKDQEQARYAGRSGLSSGALGSRTRSSGLI